MTAVPVTSDHPALPKGFDPTDPVRREQGIPLQEFLELRKTAPVWWVEQEPEARAGFLDNGFWAVSRHEDIANISKDNANWSSKENGVIIRFAPEMTREQVDLQQVMLIHHDPPEHTKLRQIISRGFTPRAINAMKERLRERADSIVDEALAKGEGDFVSEVAAELPLQAIAELLGVPQDDRGKLFDWSNQMLAYEDPDFDGDQELAAAEILGYSMALAADRKEHPADDIISKLVSAEVNGERGLTDDEFGYFVILLAVAGNETTRNAISHGMKAFFDNPDQWDLWVRERPDTMVDEVIRWATPVSVFQRTALNDVVVGGQRIKKGDRVGLFYASANHDEDVFENPDTFDITREVNPHLAFGGHGAHYCIGANLARMEIKLMFDVIADRMPNLKPNGEPRRLRHSWINGIKEMPVTYA